MSSDWAAEFERLMETVLDGRAAVAEQARLDELLAANPEALEAYVQFMSLDTMLQALLGAERLAAENAPAPAGCSLPPAVLSLAADEGQGVAVPPTSTPQSPILGFLGNISRRSWEFLSGHIGMLALLLGFLFVGSLGTWAVMTFRSGLFDEPQMAQEPPQETGTLASRI